MEYAFPVAEVAATCNLCGARHAATVGAADLARYRAGALVQDAFPEADVDTRELVIGSRAGFFMCPACYAAMGDDD